MPKLKQIHDDSPKQKARSSSAEPKPQATPAQTRSKQQRDSEIPEVNLEEITTNHDSSSTEEKAPAFTEAQMQIFQQILKENTEKLSAKHEQQMHQREIEIDLL